MDKNKIKLESHKLSDYPQEIENIFHFLSISSNYFLIGSASYKNFLYSSDYDLNERYKAKDTETVLNKLYENFKEKFKVAKENPDYFIIDFKCSETNDGEPIRWGYGDIMKGYQTINNKRYNFTDCLLQKGVMKLDMIVCVNGVFTEVTDNYFVTIGKHKNYNDQSKKEIIQNLILDYNEQIEDKKYMKALKRLFSIQAIEGKPSKKLIDLMNSDSGRLYKTISDINTTIVLIEQTFKPVSLNKIKHNLQLIKYFSSKITTINSEFITKDIDNICETVSSKVKLKNGLEKLVNKLNGVLNKSVEKYLIKIT
jgi:hypothetical protein